MLTFFLLINNEWSEINRESSGSENKKDESFAVLLLPEHKHKVD